MRVVVCDMTPQEESSFLLVYSSSANARPGSMAPLQHSVVLSAATKDQAAVVGNVTAVCVYTNGVLEGLLLAERPPKLGPCDDAKIDAILGVRLWANMLGERMEKLQWRQEAQESRHALSAVLDTMERVVAQDMKDDTNDMAASMIPPQVVQGRVVSDRLSLWFCDHGARELVLNNSGHLDGTRLPVGETIIGDALEGKIVCLKDVDKDWRFNRQVDEKTDFQTKSMICVALTDNRHRRNIGSITSLADVEVEPNRQAVVQFKNGCVSCQPDQNVRDLTHFDLVGAEALQGSVLPTVLWLRDCFMQLLAAERQRADLKTVVAHLEHAHTVADVVRLVESELTDAMSCEACTLYFIDESMGEVWAPRTESLPDGIRMKIGEGLVGHVAQDAMNSADVGVLVVSNPSSCPYWGGDIGTSCVTRNIMTAPVRSQAIDKRLIGMIQIINKFKAGSAGKSEICSDEGSIINFTNVDVTLLEILSQAVGSHIQRLLVEIMWAKTRFDIEKDSDDDDDGETPDMVEEYYSSGLRRRNANLQNDIQKTIASRTVSIFGTGPVMKFQSRATLIQSIDIDEEGLLDDLLQSEDSGAGREFADICEWRVDYWSLKKLDAFGLFLQVLRYHDVFAYMPVQQKTLYRFFTGIRDTYLPNPYHNFEHALSTVHYTFKLLQAAEMCDRLDRTDLFAIYVGALCHDCDHRGRNNAFEVRTRSVLALRYNDSSPLENHHCARAFEVALCNNGCNIFKGLSADTYMIVRRRVIAGILSTDMRHHGHHVDLMQTFQFQKDVHDSQSQFLVEVVLHTADISNPFMPPDISAQWGKALAEEFGCQTAEERKLGIPVTGFMDGLLDPIVNAKSQLNFINFVVHPLVDPLFRLCPGLVEARAFLDRNKEEHQKMLDQARRDSREAHRDSK